MIPGIEYNEKKKNLSYLFSSSSFFSYLFLLCRFARNFRGVVIGELFSGSQRNGRIEMVISRIVAVVPWQPDGLLCRLREIRFNWDKKTGLRGGSFVRELRRSARN